MKKQSSIIDKLIRDLIIISIIFYIVVIGFSVMLLWQLGLTTVSIPTALLIILLVIYAAVRTHRVIKAARHNQNNLTNKDAP